VSGVCGAQNAFQTPLLLLIHPAFPGTIFSLWHSLLNPGRMMGCLFSRGTKSMTGMEFYAQDKD
jgi:hypothetical protein